MVDVFEIRGKVDLNLEPFTSKIKTANEELAKLGNGLNLNFVNEDNFLGKMDIFKEKMAQVGEQAEKITTAFNKIEGFDTLLEKLTLIEEKMVGINEQTDTMNTKTKEVAQTIFNWSEALSTESQYFQNVLATLEQIEIKEQERVNALGTIGSQVVEEGSQIKSNLTYYEEQLQVSKQFEVVGKDLIRGYVEQGQMLDRLIEKGQRRIQQLEREMQEAKRIGSAYLEISREQNRQLTYEQEALMVEKEFATVIKDEMVLKENLIKLTEPSLALEKEILALMGDKVAMTGEEIAEETKKINALRQELDLAKEIAMVEKEEIGLIAEETAEIERLNAQRLNGAKGNKLDKFGYLPSRISSMAITMLGYQEIMDVWQKTTSNINAKTQFNSYADLLKTDNRYLKQTKQSTADVTKGINELNKALTDTYNGGKNLQQMYSKVDMRQVGANALDTAFKYGVQAENLDELTEVMAIYSSEFVRQGRSQEDSILAVNDALDGEFRRLKEVNIGKEDLEKRGYKEGDTLSLIRAMREIAEERGYDVTAQKITTLSEAINQAELELAFLVSDLFELAEPSLIYALGKIVELFRWLGDGVKQLKEYLQGLPQPIKEFLKQFGGNVMLGFVGLWIGKKIWSAVSNMSLFGGAWEKLMEKLGRTKGMDKATESMGKMGQTTGGTVSNTSAKDGLKNWGKNLAKNLGKMAEVFIEVAVAIAMAWALLKEAMWMIADIGKQWEAQKSEFNQGMDFIKSYGIWILGISAVLIGFFAIADKIPVDVKSLSTGFSKVAVGLAEAMIIIAEAIGLLILPMTAIALLGGTASFLGTNLDKGLEVISWIGNALHQIDLPVALFIGGFLAISLLLGLVQPLTIGLAVGIASALLLVTEAIVMLIPPLGAIALLGGTASMLGEDKINQGAETIALIGRVLNVLADAMMDLVVVDLGVFADRVLNFATHLMNGGKDAMTTLTEDILPSLRDFIKDFNAMDFSVTVDSAKVQAVTTMAEQIPPMFRAVQKLTNSLGGGDFSVSFMGFKLESNSGLGSKLDALYEDIRAVMDFARKLGGLSTANGGANATAITQTANAIAQLKAKLDQFVNTISSYSDKVHTASDRLGKSLPNGFKSGASTFSATVVTVLASGISEVQARYPTMNSGGKALGQKLVDGFKNHKPSLKTVTSKEIDYALDELDDRKSEFYDKGKDLGSELTRGYQDGADIHSPGLIARTTARELRYTMDALDVGKQMMYQGGVALGQALTNGYNSYGNLRTDVGVLASKGVSNEQLQANARSVQANTKGKGQTQQSFNPTINIDMSNSTVIGVTDLNAKIQQAVEQAIVRMNTPNGAIGY